MISEAMIPTKEMMEKYAAAQHRILESEEAEAIPEETNAPIIQEEMLDAIKDTGKILQASISASGQAAEVKVPPVTFQDAPEEKPAANSSSPAANAERAAADGGAGTVRPIYLRQSINSMPREFFKISSILNLDAYNPWSYSFRRLKDMTGKPMYIKQLKSYQLKDDPRGHGYKMLAVVDGAEAKVVTKAAMVVKQLDDIETVYRQNGYSFETNPIYCMAVQLESKHLKLIDAPY